jgi:hypothetical protein
MILKKVCLACKKDTENNFKTVFNYLVSIDDRLSFLENEVSEI